MAVNRDNSKLLTYEAFEGSRKQPKDYHAMFNHKSNVINTLDNAKYHKGLPDDTPSGSWTKARMMQGCATYDIELNVKEYRSTLWANIKTHIAANIVAVIVQMVMDRGHRVVFTPP
ncbi:hypothetical protein H310_13567 [Aphanomyces invadans]|uniref:Uncharacterized protein n=1 Tax=Aphanomyces invadans TaxID=157072 RepID=A0A024TFC8_9STRA|nr:hypothetical protein H310_13567 [Aphanomyces invadans]ETV92042.1 hypothetical protein H310_13567 [Aphanomyces invadans]|eukprot:XP_008879339.1 hypothetical protein H310_13567 [Aphanomyces invadans]